MLVRQARRDAIGQSGQRNLVRAWVWQRNVGVALCLEVAAGIDAWLFVSRPPAADLLAIVMTLGGILGAWLIWRSCNRTLMRMGARRW